ncbi:sulfurtransferase [Corynebacterium incognita]|uniref:Sulfurtransferase n=1 Tax=Corynebacterium incognita TaxID=2754725 RepID=A0A7G7CRK2_9CORY|nr:sulfurtransferase [Corynebacterium incognita]QNE90218.1 sulfurtransferase [Corynebacterium incognita]
MSILISPQQLHDDIHTGQPFTLLASHWEPHEGAGEGQFRSLHIPTARFCDAAAALAGIPGSTVGRNPLPDPEQLQKWFELWGLKKGRDIVVYDEGRGLLAARAWWILKWAGVDNVRIVDGGLARYRAEGFPTLVGPGNIAVGCDVEVNAGSARVATIEDVKAHDGLLVDTREPNRFAGLREILDLKAGHIPGAINVPERELLNPDRTFKTPEEIRDIFAHAGVTTGEGVIVYSGSGNHSAQALAAMEMVGLTGAAHFVGGWSQWSANPDNPVERA